MATISITIPDAQVSRVVDALCTGGHYSDDLGVTRNTFAKQEVARLVKERVLLVEREAIDANARQQAGGLVGPDVD